MAEPTRVEWKSVALFYLPPGLRHLVAVVLVAGFSVLLAVIGPYGLLFKTKR